MTKVHLYLNSQTRAYLIDECFDRQWALEEYSSASDEYDGLTEGEADYILPDGYELAEDQLGCPHIYHGAEACQLLTTKAGNPQLVDSGSMVTLYTDPVTTYLATIGRKGGAATSPEKAASSAANGKKGGRPPKEAAE